MKTANLTVRVIDVNIKKLWKNFVNLQKKIMSIQNILAPEQMTIV